MAYSPFRSATRRTSDILSPTADDLLREVVRNLGAKRDSQYRCENTGRINGKPSPSPSADGRDDEIRHDDAHHPAAADDERSRARVAPNATPAG
jgi:hypothetical protein